MEKRDKEEWKDSLKRFIKSIRENLLRSKSIKDTINFTMLDIAQMVISIPEEIYPQFKEILDELTKEYPLKDFLDEKLREFEELGDL